MHRVFTLLVAALLWSVLPGARAESAAERQLKRALSELHTFHARFEQQLFDEYGKPLETSSGQVYIARPGRFDWVYETPYKQRIVSDGKTLWIYDEDLEQVTINGVDQAQNDSPGRLLGDDVDLDAAFDVAEAPAAEGMDWLRLSPKSAERQFSEIEIGLRDGEVVAMRLKDNLGQTTALRFEAIERNQPLDPTLFEFAVPEGVDVLHGTGG